MSILFENNEGWILSHPDYIKRIYRNTKCNEKFAHFKFKDSLFAINSTYSKGDPPELENEKPKRKRKNQEIISDEAFKVQNLYEKIKNEAGAKIFAKTVSDTNVEAVEESKKCYSLSDLNIFAGKEGGNSNDYPLRVTFSDHNFYFPANCHFFCKDIKNISNWTPSEPFNFILLDPPWRNKYIRRKKSKNLEESYHMLYDEELKKIPIKNLLSENGLIVVWCTNSEKHLNALLNDLFSEWGVKFLAKWFWLKVTQSGEPTCKFNKNFGKQPFEQVIIGCHSKSDVKFPDTEKLIVSVPSALHSHKPPLVDVFKDFVGPDSKCLELFARYLLPGWTSWGLEVCRFQHECFFEEDEV